MAGDKILLEQGTLWPRVVKVTTQALDAGALRPIETTYDALEECGVRFQIRVVSNLVRKKRASAQKLSAPNHNPFLSYEPAMFVAEVTDTHICLLNKYNVIDHHLLIVTRDFEQQETPLTGDDFLALWVCMAEFDGLAFYNSGISAGASQTHRHLQIVPLPLTRSGHGVPIESVFDLEPRDGRVGTVRGLPFRHAFVALDPDWLASPIRTAAASLECYRTMLDKLATDTVKTPRARPGPYNLLVTRRWMLLVPRTQERFQSISINALGFAGALLVTDTRGVAVLREHGPMTALVAVA